MEIDNSAIFGEIDIELRSLTPKYLQLKDAIVEAIHQNRIKPFDRLPSINQMSYHLDISRDTVERGYRHLKKIGVLASVPSKGFYIQQPEQTIEKRILVLINELNEKSTKFCNAFLKEIGEKAIVVLQVYNNEADLFIKLIENRHHDFTHYVMIPPPSLSKDTFEEYLGDISKENLVIISDQRSDTENLYNGIYLNICQSITNILNKHAQRIKKYHTIKVLPGKSEARMAVLLTTLDSFARSANLQFTVIKSLEKLDLQKGDLLFQMSEDDIIPFIDSINTRAFKVGEDFGIISFHESAYLNQLGNGVFSLFIDYSVMGTETAKIVLSPKILQIEMPLTVVNRASF